MRRTATAILVSGFVASIAWADGPTHADAPDDRQSELKELADLCRTVTVTQMRAVAAIQAATATCAIRDCRVEEDSDDEAQDERHAYDVALKEYRLTAKEFWTTHRSKPDACVAVSDHNIVQVPRAHGAYLQTLFENHPDPRYGAHRSDCERACGQLRAGAACIENCRRYPIGPAEPAPNEESIPVEVMPERPTNGSTMQSRLLIHFEFPPSAESYEEGAVPFVRIRRGDDLVVEQEANENPLSFSLAPGTYELSSYVRPCAGNCGYLEGPRDECQAIFALTANQDLHVTTLVQAQHICTLQFR